MNRNEFFLKTGATMLTLATASNLLGQDHHEHTKETKKGNTKKDKYARAKMNSIHCILAAQDCLSHCITLMGSGDKSMFKCAESTRDVIATCNAFLSMASQDSAFLKKMASLCIEVCQACAKECKQHAEHHEECKACMKSCNDCIKEMKKIA